MKIIEFGKENEKIIMLLHGGGLSWWNYEDQAKLLEKDYHVIIPVLDGHADSDADFCGIEENAGRIITFIDENYGGSVLMIGGLSLGAQILVEILAQRSDICKYAIIESALILPMKMTYFFIEPTLSLSYGLIKKEWFAKLQFKSLKIRSDLYQDYYRDTCKISKKNMISFLKANSLYEVKPGLMNTKARVHIWVGQKEQREMRLSAQHLHEMIPNSVLDMKDGLSHGEFSLNHADLYVKEVSTILSST